MTVRITKEDGGFAVRFPYDQNLVRLIKNVVTGAQFHDSKGKRWWIGAGPLQIRRLRNFVDLVENRFNKNVSISDEAEELAQEVWVEYQEELEREREWTDERGEDGLYGFQRDAVEEIKERRKVLLTASMGLGKTVIAIKAIAEMEDYPIVCVVPASVKEHWRREFIEWTDLEDDEIAVLEGMDPDDDPMLADKKAIILNYAILGPRVDKLGTAPSYVFDEAHFLKNHESNRSQHALEVVEGATNVIELTGTPIVNEPTEIFHPITILGYDDAFGGFKGFTEEFAPREERRRRDGTTYPVYNTDEAKLLRLHNMLASMCMIRINREDVIEDLPEVQRTVQPVEITNRSEYEEAEEQFIEWYREKISDMVEQRVQEAKEDGTWDELLEEGFNPRQKIEEKVRAARRAEALLKVGELKRTVGQGKIDATAQTVANAVEEGEQVIVFCEHVNPPQDVAGGIQEKLEAKGISVGKVTGNTPEKDRMGVVDRFQDGELDVFIGSLAAAEGLTLTAAHTMVFAELFWTPGKLDQAEARAYARMNDMHGLNAIYIVGQDTVDQHVWAKLADKREMFAQVVDGKAEADYDYEVGEQDIQASVVEEIVGGGQ